MAEPHARQAYLDQYGCAKWTPEALATIAELSPLIELGAGQGTSLMETKTLATVTVMCLGQWQKALTEMGADVLAYDNDSSLQPSTTPVGRVLAGDESKLPWYPLHTLLLVYPPDSDMASEALKQYHGDYLVYVGEARGGVNADDGFFEALEQGWDCVVKLDLEPFPRCYERLYVLRRQARDAYPWWASLSLWW